MSAPKFVNTTDGLCWTRREVTRDGVELYALEAVKTCPAHLMETYAELKERGIADSADVLPVPVGPEASLPRGREWAALLARYERALAPFCGDSAAAAVAVMAVRDHEAEFLLRDAQRSQDRVIELEAERHTTNEALDDVVQELRARQSCPCPPADQPGPHQVGCPLDGVPLSTPSERPVDELTTAFSPVAALCEVLDGEHYAQVHHGWRLGRDLPETGGAL